MQDFFQLNKHQTTIRAEVLAGFTTFFTMAYIIFVNPAILSRTGMAAPSVLIATCVAAAVGTLIMGLWAGYPFALAPGMGLNAFFTYYVVLTLGYTWQQGLAIVFISGILFIVLTITGLRTAIVKAIPQTIKQAIPPGIGLFIALIGFNNAGLIRFNQGPILDIIYGAETLEATQLAAEVQAAPAQVLELGKLGDPGVQLAIIGFTLLTLLYVLRVRASFLVAILATTVIGIPMGVTQIPESFALSSLSVSDTFVQMDLSGLLTQNGQTSISGILLSLLLVIISFTLVDLFDTIGTLLGTAAKGNLLDKEGNLPRMNRALMADAVATTVGALLGTSTVTTYIESGSGIVAGGRTGLTAVVVASVVPFFYFIGSACGHDSGSGFCPRTDPGGGVDDGRHQGH